MNDAERKLRKEAWLRVFHHEISRRRKIAEEHPKAYRKLFSHNPKRLREQCVELHVWVPATTLWIHDGVKGSIIAGFNRRGFKEAIPYKTDELLVIPQICWNCCCTREKIQPLMSWSERQKKLADHIRADFKGKPRGKKGRDIMLDEFEDLFVD